MARKCLVSVSQDTHFSETRCKNLRKGDADLQIKLTKLFSEISCKQQSLLGYTLDLTINSMNEIMNNNLVHAFANIPTNKKLIQRICMGSKQSRMKKTCLHRF